jgi:hypothetical protein
LRDDWAAFWSQARTSHDGPETFGRGVIVVCEILIVHHFFKCTLELLICELVGLSAATLAEAEHVEP